MISVSKCHADFVNRYQIIIEDSLPCFEGFLRFNNPLTDYMNQDIHLLATVSDYIEKGILPDKDGLSDQNFKMISAANYWLHINKIFKTELENEQYNKNS